MSAKLGKTARFVGVAIAAGALVFGGANASAAPTEAAAPAHVQTVKPAAAPIEMDVTSENIEQAMQISQEKPVLFDVGAEWCGPCQQLKPVISGFAHDDNGKWMLGKIDADRSPELVERFKVDGYPTVVGIYKGQEVDRMVGYDGNPQSVRQFIDGVLQSSQG